MPNSDLEKYVENARNNGAGDAEIKESLIKAGWAEKDVDLTLVPKASDSSKLPLPPVPHFGMWVGFQYIILFITLYISSLSFAGVVHYAIDRWIPDALEKNRYFNAFSDETLRWYLAALIVAFPIYAFLFLFLKKQELAKPAVKNIRARKQLIYITLIVTFLIMIGDLIKTIYDLLSGQVTARSISNFAATVVISGTIFAYYLLQVKEDRKQS